MKVLASGCGGFWRGSGRFGLREVECVVGKELYSVPEDAPVIYSYCNELVTPPQCAYRVGIELVLLSDEMMYAEIWTSVFKTGLHFRLHTEELYA